MKAEVASMTAASPDHKVLARAGMILKKGGLVAFPTETVYGLGGNALDPEASRRIYAAKGRPSDNPLIVHIADMKDLEAIAASVPEKAYEMAKRFWPGPLTMIFSKTDMVPLETTGGLETVAVRFPSDPIAQELIRCAGGYVAAPSANTSGRPSPTTAQHVIDDLGDTIDMIIDSGPVGIGLESTIIDFSGDTPVILRPGYISPQMAGEIVPDIRIDPGLLKETGNIRPKAPGMKYRHYAPKAELTVVEGSLQDVTLLIREKVKESIKQGMAPGVIASEETFKCYTEGDVRCIGSRSDEESIARHLYQVLRAFDDDGVQVIWSEAFDTPSLGQAIMNRLLKAAGHRVIYAGGNKNDSSGM